RDHGTRIAPNEDIHVILGYQLGDRFLAALAGGFVISLYKAYRNRFPEFLHVYAALRVDLIRGQFCGLPDIFAGRAGRTGHGSDHPYLDLPALTGGLLLCAAGTQQQERQADSQKYTENTLALHVDSPCYDIA